MTRLFVNYVRTYVRTYARTYVRKGHCATVTYVRTYLESTAWLIASGTVVEMDEGDGGWVSTALSLLQGLFKRYVHFTGKLAGRQPGCPCCCGHPEWQR